MSVFIIAEAGVNHNGIIAQLKNQAKAKSQIW
jgi:sialic acid synthase SpsE